MSILSDIKDTIKDISDTIFGEKNPAPQLAPVPVQKMEGETPRASSLFGINAGNMVRTGAFALLGLFGASSITSCSNSFSACNGKVTNVRNGDKVQKDKQKQRNKNNRKGPGRHWGSYNRE
jgi:hypothetical protein